MNRRWVTLGIIATAVSLGGLGPGSQNAYAQSIVPSVAPKPFEQLSRTLIAGRDSLVRLTRQQVGLKYRFGAKKPGIAFDCSALVQWIAGLFGKDLPRTAAEQAQTGLEIPRDTANLLPGDLLMFGKGKRIDHVGIYIGDGRYVHAANRRKGVIESDLSRAKSTYWKSARRIFLDTDSIIAPLLEIPATDN